MAMTRSRHVRVGAKLKLATWNCGGLSYTQRELCTELDYDILALTETHDKGNLHPNKHFITGDAVPVGDPYAGVAMIFSDNVAKCVMHTGCRGSRIVYAMICFSFIFYEGKFSRFTIKYIQFQTVQVAIHTSADDCCID